MTENATSNRASGPFDLARTPIHLDTAAAPGDNAVPVDGFAFDGESFERYIAEFCGRGSPGRLIMVESSPGNWGAWECHTEGDEIVIVLEGKAVFIQQVDGAERRMPVGPGSTVINPAGVWHTADVEQPMRAIYITPCPGTEHRPR